jgi:ribosomal protein S18 acetylase RimI-like enzyme
MTASSLLRNAPRDGLQALDLSRHLRGMAELIELCFNVTLDAGGHGLIREMVLFSHAGPLLKLLDWIPGGQPYWNQGYVWLEAGRVVGCASAHRADAHSPRWLVANVAVHPDYRRKGIALALMRATLDHIRDRGGAEVILQVDDDNAGAIALYHQLGFRRATTQTVWKRASHASVPAHYSSPFDVRLRGVGEWHAQWQLAQLVRPYGLQWNEPLAPTVFRPTFWQTFEAFLEGQSVEHWMAEADSARVAGSLLIHFNGWSSDALTLLVHPGFAGQVERPLLVRGLRRLGQRPWSISIEHPADDEATASALRELDFQPGRTFRWLMAEVR